MDEAEIIATIKRRIAIYREKQERFGNSFGPDTLTEWDAYELCIGAMQWLADDLKIGAYIPN